MAHTYTDESIFDNRYKLKKFLGSGSFGEVWLAVDQQTEMEVAIKIYIAMDSKGLKDFIEEYKLPFNLNHTNLLHANYLGVCQSDNRPYLVMPYCPQGSASGLIGNITEDKLWIFIRDVASGLAYLHSQNPAIIHQDIKPDNILVAQNGDFVITDFGISKQARSTLRRSSKDASSAGTIAYMSPEHFMSGYNAIKASDVWALGATVYELAMGTLPFCGYGGSMLNHGADMAEISNDFSSEMNKIMQACLSKDPWNRPIADELATYASFKVKGAVPPIPSWEKVKDTEEIQDKDAITNTVKFDKQDFSKTNKYSKANNAQEYNKSQPIEEKKKSYEGIVWVAVVIFGLIIGSALQFFI